MDAEAVLAEAEEDTHAKAALAAVAALAEEADSEEADSEEGAEALVASRLPRRLPRSVLGLR